jgi:hypothetical protein
LLVPGNRLCEEMAMGWKTVPRVGVAAAVVIELAGALAACGTAGPVHHPVRSPAWVAARVAVPPGGSPAEARSVGRQMLASLILPHGSRRIAPRSRPPRAELIGGQNVIDVAGFYWLPVPEGAALRYVLRHVPAGTSLGGQGLYGDTFTVVNYSLQAPPSGLEQSSELLATLMPASEDGTVLRADAELEWYPPRSAAEYLPPAGFRTATVTLTPGLQPQAKPLTAITRLVRSQAAIGRLARLLDSLHATTPWTGSCPAGLPQIQIVFAPNARGNTRAAPVTVSSAGCNGEDVTTGGGPQPILEDFDGSRLLAVIAPLLGLHGAYWR